MIHDVLATIFFILLVLIFFLVILLYLLIPDATTLIREVEFLGLLSALGLIVNLVASHESR